MTPVLRREGPLPGREVLVNDPVFRVAPQRCTSCGRCLTVCPHRIPVRGSSGLPEADPEAGEACLRCGHCVAVCPEGALRHRDLDSSLFPAASSPPEPEAVIAWLRARRSVRAYAPRPVGRPLLKRLLEAARFAPTGHNARHLGCVAVVTRGRRERLQRGVIAFYRRLFRLIRNPAARAALGPVVGRGRAAELRDALPGMLRAEARLARGEDPLFHGAPVILLFHAPPAETAETDCALAAGQVTLLAPSLGLGTCYIGYASAALKRLPGLASRFGVPRTSRVYTVLSVGHPNASFHRWVPRPSVPVRFV